MSHVEIISLDMNMQRNIQNLETRHRQELANRDKRPSLSIKSNWFLRQKPEAGILLRIPIPSFRSESADRFSWHWIFLSLFSSHCSSCDDPCSHIVPTWSKPGGRELPWRRIRRQWAAFHTRRTSYRTHCDQPPVVYICCISTSPFSKPWPLFWK